MCSSVAGGDGGRWRLWNHSPRVVEHRWLFLRSKLSVACCCWWQGFSLLRVLLRLLLFVVFKSLCCFLEVSTKFFFNPNTFSILSSLNLVSKVRDQKHLTHEFTSAVFAVCLVGSSVACCIAPWATSCITDLFKVAPFDTKPSRRLNRLIMALRLSSWWRCRRSRRWTWADGVIHDVRRGLPRRPLHALDLSGIPSEIDGLSVDRTSFEHTHRCANEGFVRCRDHPQPHPITPSRIHLTLLHCVAWHIPYTFAKLQHFFLALSPL